jgi:hypothetical protein
MQPGNRPAITGVALCHKEVGHLWYKYSNSLLAKLAFVGVTKCIADNLQCVFYTFGWVVDWNSSYFDTGNFICSSYTDVFFVLGDSLASGFCVLTSRLFLFTPPLKMEQSVPKRWHIKFRLQILVHLPRSIRSGTKCKFRTWITH